MGARGVQLGRQTGRQAGSRSLSLKESPLSSLTIRMTSPRHSADGAGRGVPRFPLLAHRFRARGWSATEPPPCCEVQWLGGPVRRVKHGPSTPSDENVFGED